MKPTEKKVQDNSDSKLESATNTSKEKKTFYERLMEKGYSESKTPKNQKTTHNPNPTKRPNDLTEWGGSRVRLSQPG
jgi:hypothetical protein